MPVFTRHCRTAMCLEAKSKDKLSSRVRSTCLTFYLVSFRRPAVIYLMGPRRLMRQPSRRYQGCESSGQLFKTRHSMSPPPYGWCETTRSARHDQRPILCHTIPLTSALARVRFNKNDFELSKTTGDHICLCDQAALYPNGLLTRARRRGTSGWDRWRGVGRAHPTGHAPQLGAAGRYRG